MTECAMLIGGIVSQADSILMDKMFDENYINKLGPYLELNNDVSPNVTMTALDVIDIILST